MRLIIEARVELAESDLQPEPRRLAVFDRMEDDLEQLGLTLEEGRELLAATQAGLVASQAEQWLATEDCCRRCCTPLYDKDSRWVVFRTVFGKVRLQSPRFWSCTCDRSRGTRRHTFSALSERLPRRIAPELKYLQVRWAAHMPSAATTALLKEVLGTVSFGGVTRLIADGSTAKTRLAHRDTPPFETVPCHFSLIASVTELKVRVGHE